MDLCPGCGWEDRRDVHGGIQCNNCLFVEEVLHVEAVRSVPADGGHDEKIDRKEEED